MQSPTYLLVEKVVQLSANLSRSSLDGAPIVHEACHVYTSKSAFTLYKQYALSAGCCEVLAGQRNSCMIAGRRHATLTR
jgi:hypothetical protein